MNIDFYTKAGSYLTRIDKVISCDTNITLGGVITLNFDTLLTSQLEIFNDDESYMVYFENEYYDICQISRSLNRGMYTIKFSCEHISYRLSSVSKSAFSFKGTPRKILTELLKGTEFVVGNVDFSVEQTISIQEESTIRSIILKFADILNADVDFTGYFVSMYEHKGRKTPIEVIDKNVVSISKTVKTSASTPSYSITLYQASLIVGDELHLKFDKLGINENVRLVGIKRKPFTSKNVEIEVGESESTLEADLVSIESEVVSKDKSIYGVKISSNDGLTISREDNTAKVIMNADEFRMQGLGEDGELEDKLYFDPDSGEYKFKGSITVDSGTININNKFIVDEEGNAYLSGNSTIYGGKYYAGSEGSGEGFSQMTSTGFEVFNSVNDLKLRFGFTTSGEDYPFIQLGSGVGAYQDYGLVKKFTDGLWIGNREPADASGEFEPKEGYNGIFFRFGDNTAYVVKDTNMKNIYTGAAIAKFG